MKLPNKQQILKRREEIEEELSGLLKKIEREFDLKDIKKIIYNEDGKEDLIRLIFEFDQGKGLTKINDNTLQLINDAWNYFPHKSLGGLCPMEKLLEYQKK